MGKLSSPSPRSWSPPPKMTRFRMFPVLILGCNIFFMLYNAFGRPQAPTFELTATFPKKIWQSWKVDSVHFEDRDIERVRTWTKMNPRHQYEVLTDDNAESYVQYHFGASGFNRPDIVSTYMALSQPNTRIIQADLLRYLILYAEGGVWADIDVEALRPVDSFIPRGFQEADISMVVGIETDEPALRDHPILGSKAQSLCQWTFMTKPRTAIMMRLINHILVWLNEMAQEQGCTIPEVEMDFDAVLSGTGPSAFTNAILAEMSKATGETITWNHFHGLEDSMVVAGVLVLPSEAFAAGTGHSRSGNHFGQRALVKHHFHASSWTKKHQRWKHPIYDEVEKCNWKVECVKLWDANVAAFDALSEEEQLKIIDMKRFPSVQTAEPPTAEQKPVDAAASTQNAAPVKGGKTAEKSSAKEDMKKESSANPKPEAVKGAQEDNKQPSKEADKSKPAPKEGSDLATASKLIETAKKPMAKPVEKPEAKDGKANAPTLSPAIIATQPLKEVAEKLQSSPSSEGQKPDQTESLDLSEEEQEGDAGSRIATMLMKGPSATAQNTPNSLKPGVEKTPAQLLTEAYNAKSSKKEKGGAAVADKTNQASVTAAEKPKGNEAKDDRQQKAESDEKSNKPLTSSTTESKSAASASSAAQSSSSTLPASSTASTTTAAAEVEKKPLSAEDVAKTADRSA